MNAFLAFSNGATHELVTGQCSEKSSECICAECHCMHSYCHCCYGWPGCLSWQLPAVGLLAMLLMNQTDKCNDNDGGGYVGADVSDNVGGAPSGNDELGMCKAVLPNQYVQGILP